MAHNSKIWREGDQKIVEFFNISQKPSLFGPTNSHWVTYSKIQTKVCRIH